MEGCERFAKYARLWGAAPGTTSCLQAKLSRSSSTFGSKLYGAVWRLNLGDEVLLQRLIIDIRAESQSPAVRLRFLELVHDDTYYTARIGWIALARPLCRELLRLATETSMVSLSFREPDFCMGGDAGRFIVHMLPFIRTRTQFRLFFSLAIQMAQSFDRGESPKEGIAKIEISLFMRPATGTNERVRIVVDLLPRPHIERPAIRRRYLVPQAIEELGRVFATIIDRGCEIDIAMRDHDYGGPEHDVEALRRRFMQPVQARWDAAAEDAEDRAALSMNLLLAADLFFASLRWEIDMVLSR